jgi:hypothetical protein
VHIVGFIIRIYQDARSSERQIPHLKFAMLRHFILCPGQKLIFVQLVTEYRTFYGSYVFITEPTTSSIVFCPETVQLIECPYFTV